MMHGICYSPGLATRMCSQSQHVHTTAAVWSPGPAWNVSRHMRATVNNMEGRRCSTFGIASQQASIRRLQPKCHAAADDSQGTDVFQGMYGPWRIEQEDILEVWTYRVGLTATVAAFIATAAICSTTDPSAAAAAGQTSALTQALNPLALLGAASFGVSLVQIHIYMSPVKRTLQALWALGVLGAVYLALTHSDQPLPLLVAQQPWATWFVGPVAAAATGVAIKEGLCYGKLEAAGLALLLPLLCLSHLSGLAPAGVQQTLLVTVCGVAAVFAARKYSQPVKDDIGDKSVFVYLKQQQGRMAPPQDNQE